MATILIPVDSDLNMERVARAQHWLEEQLPDYKVIVVPGMRGRAYVIPDRVSSSVHIPPATATAGQRI